MRERAHRRAGLTVIEQESLKIGDHMLGRAAHHHLIGRAGNRHQRVTGHIFPQRRIRIKLRSRLVKHSNLQICAELYRPGIWRNFTGQDL